MKILSVETSSSLCSVALLHENGCESMSLDAPMQQTKLLLPEIDKLLKKHSCTLSELSAIAFGCGPGSFTGIRIATSFAQGFAFALNIPVIPISSLAAIAQTAYDQDGFNRVLILVDARKHEVYYGCYAVDAAGLMNAITEEMSVSPSSIVLPVSLNEEWVGLGNGWKSYVDELSSVAPKKIAYHIQPLASSVAKLAKRAFELGQGISAFEAMPHYLQNPFINNR